MCVGGGGARRPRFSKPFPLREGLGPPCAGSPHLPRPARGPSRALPSAPILRPALRAGPARASPDLAQSSAPTPGAGPGRPSSTVFPSFHREKFLAARLHSKLPGPVRRCARSPAVRPSLVVQQEASWYGWAGLGRGRVGLGAHGPLGAPLQFLVRCLWPQDGELMAEETKETGAEWMHPGLGKEQ